MTRAARALAAALVAGACATEARPPATPVTPPAERGFHALTPQGVGLLYDAQRRVYAVPSRPGAYWLDGHYYERAGDGWQTSERPTGPWRACPEAELPAGLRAAP